MAEPLSKRQIRNIMRAEHKSAGITKINPGLYRALNQYLQRLQEAYLEAHAQNKTQKALTLTKEIRDTERDVSTIYELRERKILLMAQDTVRGGAPSLKYLFPEEKLLLLRLSSILLETRRDIRIDFHHHVDKYLRTIAREYDLERKLFAPFHPTAPFCEDVMDTPEQPVTAVPSPLPKDEEGREITHVQADDGPGTGGLVPDKTAKVDEVAPGQEPMEPEVSTSGTPAQEEYERLSEGESAGPETKRIEKDGSGEPRGESEASGEGKLSAPGDVVEDDPEEGGKEAGDEEDESKGQDFLKDYTVAGTLESIPQFRASDLHDYRFEPGEIITIPTKMAELLERQKKLFIIKMKEDGSGI